MKVVRTSRTMEFDATPERLWPLLANTEKLNREMGFALPNFTYRNKECGGTEAFAELQVGPMNVRYTEHPFEWIQNRFYSIRRSFESGPIPEVLGQVSLDASGSGTRVTVRTEVECRFLPSVGKAFALRNLNQLEGACKGFREHLASASPTAYPRESGRPPVHVERLAQGLSDLRRAGVSDALCDRLSDFLSKSPAADLVHFRPLEIAARLQVDPAEFLKCCLLATRLGITDLSWRVMCPYCRSNKDLSNSLSELASQVHCEACNIDYGAGFDQNVEVVFSVSRIIRPVDVRTYCIGGPQSAVHAAAQIIVEPGETRTVDLTLAPRVWQLASLQASNRPRLVVTPGGADRCTVTFAEGSCRASTESVSSTFLLELANEGQLRVVVRVEEADWKAKAVLAA